MVNVAVSLVTAVIKVMAQTLLYQALQERPNGNDIEDFLKMVGSFQRYTRAAFQF